MEATAYLITFSTFCTILNAWLTFCIEKAIRKENIITGNPVPKAKTGGKSKLSDDFKTRGINTPKNRTPL